jgi:hypothetical protein
LFSGLVLGLVILPLIGGPYFLAWLSLAPTKLLQSQAKW